MYTNNLQQIYLFFAFIIDGIIIGILFDFFRILRKSFKTSDLITYIEDIIFWILTGIIILYSIFIFNNGQIRLFMILGMFFGIILYMLLISKYFIKLNVFIISIIKNIFITVFNTILYPLKIFVNIIKKVIFKPIFVLFINLKIFSSKNAKKFINMIKSNKKIQNKSENINNEEGF